MLCGKSSQRGTPRGKLKSSNEKQTQNKTNKQTDNHPQGGKSLELNRTELDTSDKVVKQPNGNLTPSMLSAWDGSANTEQNYSANVNLSDMSNQATGNELSDGFSPGNKQPNGDLTPSMLSAWDGSSKTEQSHSANVSSEKPLLAQERNNRKYLTVNFENKNILIPQSPSPPQIANKAEAKTKCNNLDMNPTPTPEVTEYREMKSKSLGLAHLRIGLHANKESIPSWQYGLIDSGCSDNLISVKALQALPDFEKADIRTTTASTLRTANNDASQQIHGQVTLNISLLNESNVRLTLRAPFYVVSGLVYEVFLGQPFLTSDQISHEDRTAFYFHDRDPNNPSDTKCPNALFDKHFMGNDNLWRIPKSYNMKRKVASEKRTVLAPKSATKIKTNLAQLPFHADDTFTSFRPCDQFLNRFPDLHIMHQTITHDQNNDLTVTVINPTDAPVVLKRTSHLGFIESHMKTSAYIHKLSDFIPQEEVEDKQTHELTPKVSLNHIVINSNRNNIADQNDSEEKENVPSCNTAYQSSMHNHPLTPEEKAERNKQFKQEGYFQKSVSELLDESRNIPSFNYDGDHQFVPKSDETLLAECKLDHLSSEHQKLTKEMLKRNISAFQRHPLDIGNCKDIKAYAPLTTPDPPMLYAKYVPIPLKFKAPAQKLIDEYCKAGVLAPTCEPCTFTSNIFIIPKKDNTFRLIFDGRILSKYCQALPLALGNFDEIFSDLADKTFVSKMDVSKAYDQISVTPETSRMLSFFGPDAKRYVYLRAGQGLKFSSFFLSQAMDTILFGMKNVKSYCDDIFSASNGTFEEHLKTLEEIIQRFHKFNVKLNIAKLEVAPPQLDFLGLTWSKDKLSIPKSKITAYLNLKKPKSLKEARFIVNSMAFYRRFIPKFSDTISPILELLKSKEKKFNWTPVHQTAVDKLIETIQDGVNLYLPRKDRPYIIHTDASYVAAASTISQYDDDGHLRLVAAISRSFIKSERNLAPVQKEILSLLYTFTSLQYLLKGAHLIVYADAKSITLLKTCSTSSPYLARLAMELSQYNFELYHLEGKLNLEADALSRMTKTQDKILAVDKTFNNAMTRDESLLFLEYLKIPSNYRFTVSEVKRMITSEPLKSQLTSKIKARHMGRLRSDQDNSPRPMKSKKTHEPRYTRSHPLERQHSANAAKIEIEAEQQLPLLPFNLNAPPARYIDMTTPEDHIGPSINLAAYLKTLPDHVLNPPPLPLYDSDEFDSPWPSEEDTDDDSDLEDFQPCHNSECAIHGQSEQPTAVNSLSRSQQQTWNQEAPESAQTVTEDEPTVSATTPQAASEDAKHASPLLATKNGIPPRDVRLAPNPQEKEEISENEQANFPDQEKARPSANGQTPVSPKDSQISVNMLAPSLTTNSLLSLSPEQEPISKLFSLNNTVGINNIRLSDTLQDLAVKTKIITSGELTLSEFKDAQELDPVISKLRESASNKRQTSLEIRNEILYKKVAKHFVPVLPKSLETFIFNCHHFHVLSGHRSADSIIKDIQEQFFVFDLKRKITAFCKECFICSISKSQKMQKTVQGKTAQALYPKHILSFDIFGSVETDEDGYRYVYSFIDNFSLFVINIKARTKSAKEILAAFLQVFAIWSQIPEIVCSDNETGLMTKESFDFFASFNIQHNPGASHSHWRLLSEGSSVKKSKDFMRAVLLSDPTTTWPQALALGTIALNNTKTIHGYSPLQMFYGNVKTQNSLISEAQTCKDLDSYMQLVQDKYNELVNQVNNTRTKSIDARTKLINAHRKSKEFEVGQLVWLKALNISPNRATKMKNLGPFKVIQKINTHTYKLATLSNPQKCERISHSTHLEPYKNQIDITPINFPKMSIN